MLSKNIRIAAVLLLLAFVPVFSVHAGFFNSRFDDFKELVEAGKVEDAAVLYAKEKGYFSELSGKNRQFVDEVLGQRDTRYRTELSIARVRLILVEREDGQMLRWKKLKESLPETDALLARDEKLPAPGPLVTDGMTQLRAVASRIKATLGDEAPQALLDYGLFTEPSFIAQYPVAVDWRRFSALNVPVERQLAKAGAGPLEGFKKAYGDTLIPALGLGEKLGDLYVAARLRESGASSYLARRLVRDRLAKEGWTVSGTKGNGVLLAAWSAPQSEVSTFRVASPTTVDYQSLDVEQTPEKFIAAGGAGGHDLVVFVRPARIQVARNDSNSRQVSSQYRSGTRRVQNPAYAQAVAELAKAQENLASIRRAAADAPSDTSSTLGILSAVIGGVSTASAESDVSDARQTLANTPQMVEEAVLAPYNYPAKTVSVRQSVAIRYAIYDTGTGKVSTGSTDRIWKKTFEVVDQVHAEDPNRASIMKAAKTSQYVEDWIKAPIDDKYEEIWKSIFSEYSKGSLGI